MSGDQQPCTQGYRIAALWSEPLEHQRRTCRLRVLASEAIVTARKEPDTDVQSPNDRPPSAATSDSVSEYHLAELRIAQDPAAAGHILPPIPADANAVLDIGCGAGQSLIACKLRDDVLACGVDPELAALALGKRLNGHIQFAAARGERLPFADETFDFVLSRVAMPYMHVPAAAREIARVLKPHGGVWLTLHPVSGAFKSLWHGLTSVDLRRARFALYVLANTLLLHVFGRQIAHAGDRYESAQTSGGIKRALRAAGLVDVAVSRGRFYVVTARKPGD